MASLQERVIGAMRLQPSTFEEVEHDQAATSQAAMVVVAVAISGSLFGLLRGQVVAAMSAVVLGLVVWALASFLILLIGTKLLPGKNTEADLGQLLRTVGFAQAPALFSVLVSIPLLGLLVWLVLQIWVIVAMVIAVRQALDYDDTLRAAIVVLIAWVVGVAITTSFALFGVGAAVLSRVAF